MWKLYGDSTLLGTAQFVEFKLVALLEIENIVSVELEGWIGKSNCKHVVKLYGDGMSLGTAQFVECTCTVALFEIVNLLV